MTDEHHKDTQKLVREVERKDRKFRIAQSMFMACLAVLMAGVIIAQAHVIQNQNREMNSRANEIATVQQNTNTEIAALQQHIDCIVHLFTIPNRQNFILSNIENCKFTRK